MQVFPTIKSLQIYATNEGTVTLEQERSSEQEPDFISVHISQIETVIKALRVAKAKSEAEAHR